MKWSVVCIMLQVKETEEERNGEQSGVTELTLEQIETQRKSERMGTKQRDDDDDDNYIL